MKRAFTLIELLVVIAIIAILAAILFPVFAQAKAAAKKTVNLSNIKQDNLAGIMYASDADDLLVPVQSGAYGNWTSAQTVTRMQLQYPYSKNINISRNPLDPQQTDSILYQGSTTTLDKMYNAGLRDGHGYNFFYLAPLMSDSCFHAVSSTSIGKPADTISTVDSVWDVDGPRSPDGGGNWFVQAPSYWNSTTYYWFGPWTFGNTSDWFQYGGAYDYVKGSVALSFVDGHAKVMPTPTLWAGANPANSSVIDSSKYLWGGTS